MAGAVARVLAPLAKDVAKKAVPQLAAAGATHVVTSALKSDEKPDTTPAVSTPPIA